MKQTLAFAASALLLLLAALPGASAGRLKAERVSRAAPLAEQFLSSEAAGQYRKESVVADAVRRAPETSSWLITGGTVMGVTLLLIGGLVFVTRSGQQASAKQPIDDDAAVAEGDAAGGALVAGGEASKKFNYEDFLRAMLLCAAHAAGPKITKGMRAKRALESRVAAMSYKARRFMVAEFKSIAGTVLREFEAEEAMLLLDWEAAAKHSYPSMSILLAGTASPVVLAISFYFHILQIALMFLPLLILSCWAIHTDMTSVCAIPTIYFWIVAQAVLCFVLLVSHLASAYKVQKGGRELLRKAAISQKSIRQMRASGAELTAADLQRIFVNNSTLLQHGLAVEDQLRHSPAFAIVGIGTLLWVILTLWTFVITVGWTVFPGVIAFHPKAAGVAPADEYCSALATVFTARLSCCLAFLFIFINLIQLLQYISLKLVDNPGYRKTMLGVARGIDKKTIGLPVAELVVRAFLLRGCADTLSSQLLEASEEKNEAERDYAKKKAELAGIERRLQACKSTVGNLREELSLDASSKAASQEADSMALSFSHMAEDKAKETADVLQARAVELSANSQQQLDALLQQLMELIAKLKDSDAMHDMIESAQHMAEDLQDRAKHMAQDLQDSEALQQGLERAKSMGLEAKDRALAAAEELQQSEAFQQGLATAKDMSQEAMAKASKVVDDVRQSEEFQKGVAKAQEMTKDAAAKASQVVEDVKQSEEFQKGVAKAQEMTKDAAAKASQVVEDVKQSEEFQKGVAKAQEMTKDAAAKASQVVEDVKQSEEFQKGVAKAQELSKDAAAKASKVVEDVKQSEEFQKGVAKAQEVGKDAAAKASKVVEDVKQSEEFQQGVAKAQEAASAASSAAQDVKEEAKKATDKAKKKGGRFW